MANDVLPAEGTPFGARVRHRLAEETVVWLTTVGKDGTPQPNPVWFLWDGADQILVYNRPDANRLVHIANRPQVTLNFDGNGKGGDIVVLTGTAVRVGDEPLAAENPDYLTKYGAAAARISGDPAAFAAEYSVALRITVKKIRGF
jgi:PPOX class probable F420-dependent enzyme